MAEPAKRESGRYYPIFKSIFIQQLQQTLDVPRWVRSIVRKPKEASNVNALGEVPDSTWYTNRHHRRPMTIEALVQGPGGRERPDFDSAVITGIKIRGVTPGLEVRDRKGDKYVIKFDDVKYPELQSGAEVVSTKILHAAGYNVPENYLAYIRPDRMSIATSVAIQDDQTRQPRQFKRADLTTMLRRVAQRKDGTYRVLASKVLSGKPKGPFPQVGTRRDDPKDRIPHEHRRELRGLRVIASWINHWDMKEENSIDMYVEENGRSFLRHYLIDFGSTFGGGAHPTKYIHGRESAFDIHSLFKEFVSLGFYVSANDKKGESVSPAMAIFSNNDFDPGRWKPILPVIAFDNMTSQDALWGTRIIASFKEEELRRIIQTAEYSNPRDADYLLKTLLDRRRMISRHWLSKVNPIVDFRIRRHGELLTLMFNDMLHEDSEVTSYDYEIRTSTRVSDRRATRTPSIVMSPVVFNDDTRQPKRSLVEISIWTRRGTGPVSEPVRVYLEQTHQKDLPQLVEIRR
jgi:hypothetical protein